MHEIWEYDEGSCLWNNWNTEQQDEIFQWTGWSIHVYRKCFEETRAGWQDGIYCNKPDLTAIRTYFTRWLIRTTSLVQIHAIFAKSYVFYEFPIRMNLYEWPTPNKINLWKTLYKIWSYHPPVSIAMKRALQICHMHVRRSEVHLTLFLCIYYFLKTIPS